MAGSEPSGGEAQRPDALQCRHILRAQRFAPGSTNSRPSTLNPCCAPVVRKTCSARTFDAPPRHQVDHMLLEGVYWRPVLQRLRIVSQNTGVRLG